MSETQFYISVAVVPVTTIIIVLIGVLLNNANMNARLADMDRRIEDLKDLIKAYSDRQDANLRRVEDMLRGKFAELDTRLSRIEHLLDLG